MPPFTIEGDLCFLAAVRNHLARVIGAVEGDPLGYLSLRAEADARPAQICIAESAVVNAEVEANRRGSGRICDALHGNPDAQCSSACNERPGAVKFPCGGTRLTVAFYSGDGHAPTVDEAIALLTARRAGLMADDVCRGMATRLGNKTVLDQLDAK